MVRTRQAKVDGIAALAAAARGRRPGRRRAGARPRLGLDVRADRRGLPAGPRARAARSRRPTCATSTRCRPTSARSCARYDRVVVPEMNLGQLALLLRAKYLVDVIGHNQVRGLPFRAAELAEVFKDVIDRTGVCDRHRRPRESLVHDLGMPAPVPSTRRSPLDRPAVEADRPQAKDFKTDQEVRWCPGCGDYAILAAVQGFMPELGLRPREHRLRLRDRLLLPLPVLHEHLRHALDPRPRAGDRDRAGAVPAGPVGLGGHR